MYVLTSDGELKQGLPLTDLEAEQRETLVKLLHKKICKGRTHYSFQEKERICETAANLFVTKFTLTVRDGVDMQAELDAAEDENAPEVLEKA